MALPSSERGDPQELSGVLYGTVADHAHAWTPTKHNTTVTCEADGRLVLNGDVNWRNVALPMVMEGKIKEIKQRRRDGYTLV